MFDVLVKGLCGELQPLDHRQVGEQLIGQFLHRHPGADGNGGGLDDFPRFRSHRLHAQQPAGARFGDQLDETPRVEVSQRSWHVVQGQGAAVGFEAGVLRFGFAVADGGHLRIGEHHGRHDVEIELCLAAGPC